MPTRAPKRAKRNGATEPTKKRLATPVVLQMHASECGAACLGSVLGHFGRWVPLTELRDKCEVSRDGSSAASIMRAARHYGPRRRGLERTCRGTEKTGPAGDRVLAIQPFRCRRGVRLAQLLSQRPVHGATTAFRRGIQPGLQRNRVAVQARGRFQAGVAISPACSVS